MSDPIREHYFIVPDADDAHVPLVPEGKTWTLPYTTLTGAYKWQSTAHVNKAANDIFGFRGTTRRCASPDRTDLWGKPGIPALSRTLTGSFLDPTPPQGA